MSLTRAQKQEFFDNGFIRVPNVVPRAKIDAALRVINASLGEGMNVADMPTLRARSFCPEVTNSPAIVDLQLGTAAWEIVESMIGVGKIRRPQSGQIALRFPTAGEPSAPHPHIDGMYTPQNGARQGDILSFTALAGILLSDVPRENAGNFTVWPGTHRANAAYFKQHAPQSLIRGMPAIPMPPPHQITGAAGDFVLAHYLLAHSVAANVSPNIRYMIFFRLHHVDHETQRWEAMTDAWMQWPGMREMVV